jgi:DNA-binding XRE family transcriptional regulator
VSRNNGQPGPPADGPARSFGAERVALAQAFGEHLRELRTKASLSADELGWDCGTVADTIAKTECGRPEPRLWLIVELCRALNVTPNTLLGDLVGPRRSVRTRKSKT